MPKMLLDDGGEQHEEGRFKQFQLDALDAGVVVGYYLHPGETHRMVGEAGGLERVRKKSTSSLGNENNFYNERWHRSQLGRADLPVSRAAARQRRPTAPWVTLMVIVL